MRNMVTFPQRREMRRLPQSPACSCAPGPGWPRAPASGHRRLAPAAAWRRRARAGTMATPGKTTCPSRSTFNDQCLHPASRIPHPGSRIPDPGSRRYRIV